MGSVRVRNEQAPLRRGIVFYVGALTALAFVATAFLGWALSYGTASVAREVNTVHRAEMTGEQGRSLKLSVQQFIGTVDLVFGSGETYLVDELRSQLQLINDLIDGMGALNPDAASQQALASLKLAINLTLVPLSAVEELSIEEHLGVFERAQGAIEPWLSKTVQATKDVELATENAIRTSRAALHQAEKQRVYAGLVLVSLIISLIGGGWVFVGRRISRSVLALLTAVRSARTGARFETPSVPQPAEVRDLGESFEALWRELDSEAQLRRQKEFYLQLALDSGRLGFWELSRNFSRLSVDVAAHDMLRLPALSKFSWTPKFFANLCADPDSRTSLLDAWQAIRDGRQNRFDGELAIRGADGDLRWLHLTGIRVSGTHGSDVSDFVGTVRDITAERDAAQALVAAREEADRANLAKTVFLRSMSHELRTPMNAILGFAQLLKFAPGAQFTDSQQEKLEGILRAGDAMVNLVSDVLDFSAMSSGRMLMTLKAVTVDELVNDAVSLVRPVAEQAGTAIDLDIAAVASLEIWTDPKRFRQVMLNLLSNAIKYGRVDGHGRVTVTGDSHENSLLVAIRDNGEGIPADDLPRLFQPFERLRQGEGNLPGTGLGLAICREIVTALGGGIDVESVVGEGTCFSIRLPLRGQRVSEQQPQAATEERLAEG